jgi:hypothetical protein
MLSAVALWFLASQNKTTHKVIFLVETNTYVWFVPWALAASK